MQTEAKKRTPWATLLILDDCSLTTDRKGKYFLAGRQLEPMALCQVTLDALSVDVPVAGRELGKRHNLSLADFARVWATLPTLSLVGPHPSVLRAVRNERNRLQQASCPDGRC